MASADYKFVAPAGDGDTLVGPYITSLANDRSLNVDPGHWFHSSRALEMPDGSKLPPSIRPRVCAASTLGALGSWRVGSPAAIANRRNIDQHIGS